MMYIMKMTKSLLLIPACLGTFFIPVFAVLIDDFEGYDVGSVRDTAATAAVWNTNGSGLPYILEETGNKYMSFDWNLGYRGAHRDLGPGIGAAVTSTLFFRFRQRDETATTAIGVTDIDFPGTTDENFSDFRAFINMMDDGSTSNGTFNLKSGGTTLTTGLNEGSWYNTWLVIDNETDTMDVYVNNGSPQEVYSVDKLNDSPVSFTASDDLLDRFVVSGGYGGSNRTSDVDDINLDFGGLIPLPPPPPPPPSETGGIGIDVGDGNWDDTGEDNLNGLQITASSFGKIATGRGEKSTTVDGITFTLNPGGAETVAAWADYSNVKDGDLGRYSGAVPWSFTGLLPERSYDMVFLSGPSDQPGIFTVTGVGTATPDADGDGNFENVIASATGDIAGNWDVDAGSGHYSTFTGLLLKLDTINAGWSGGVEEDGSGAGIWDTTNNKWEGDTSKWINSANDTAVFGGNAGGQVSLNEAITVGGLIFNTSGYLIAGNGNTLTLAASTPITVNESATIASNLAGSGTIPIDGGATLTITGDASGYTANTAVDAGILLIDGDFSSAAGTITVAADAALGGVGSVGGDISFADGAKFWVDTLNKIPLTVDDGATVTFADFGLDDLWNIDSIGAGTYPLLAGSFAIVGTVQNLTSAYPGTLPNGMTAYFDPGSLTLVVIPEPSTIILAGLGLAGLTLRRRRSE